MEVLRNFNELVDFTTSLYHGLEGALCISQINLITIKMFEIILKNPPSSVTNTTKTFFYVTAQSVSKVLTDRYTHIPPITLRV